MKHIVVSNAGYAVAAVAVILLGGPLWIPMSVALGVLAAGSALWHSNPSNATLRRLDEIGMYWTMATLALAAVEVSDPWVIAVTWVAFAVPVALEIPGDRQILNSHPVLIGITGAIIGAFVHRGLYIETAILAALAAVSFYLRESDDPVGLGPRHAYWHYGTALVQALGYALAIGSILLD